MFTHINPCLGLPMFTHFASIPIRFYNTEDRIHPRWVWHLCLEPARDPEAHPSFELLVHPRALWLVASEKCGGMVLTFFRPLLLFRRFRRKKTRMF